MPFTGEIIAIATVLCWTISIQCFEAASKSVGAASVNIIRIFTAIVLFSMFLFFKHGFPVPVDFPAHAWFYLSLSGVIGFFIGDIFLFNALVELGPRITMLIFSLSAPTAALTGFLFLDETYVMRQWIGMFITLIGVGIVIFERNQKKLNVRHLNIRNISSKGILFSLGGMLGQSWGYILSKTDMQTESG